MASALLVTFFPRPSRAIRTCTAHRGYYPPAEFRQPSGLNYLIPIAAEFRQAFGLDHLMSVVAEVSDLVRESRVNPRQEDGAMTC